ncbi:Tm-1-like ATP-binding domain-containing protein [Gorillibacterium sp. sgz500922]|uniref:Tm-1-like ATP-binding domain-containing protein n=1 Tax=Gorillibacterium sp. sgz500922 TaxID=3446694 RepID=UPI003F679885
MKTVAIVGTLDSKGPEFAFVRDILQGLGLGTLMIHTGVFEPTIPADVPNSAVASAAGYDIHEVAAKKDRAYGTEVLTKGMERLLPALYEQGCFDGVISFGGSGGTALATAGMRQLPVGVPKVMVSTMAGGDTSVYVGSSDIFMYPSIVDVAGINSISQKIFTNAAHAIAGMVNFESALPESDKPLVAATMFGVTTPAVEHARAYLEDRGYEVLVFHATGSGGQAMEKLTAGGYFKGVLDLTTTEWCDELFGGVLSAGPNRLEAAGRNGIPQVVSVGALDMVNFGPYDTVPAPYAGRNLYKHNPSVTLMRTTVEENRKLGEKLAEKLNAAGSPTALMLPLQGVSMIDAPGQAFYGPDEDAMLFDTLRRLVNRDKVELVELDHTINDKAFAQAAAQKLIDLMSSAPKQA